MGIQSILRKIIFREKADSGSYIAYLRRKGMRIGERTAIYSPRTVLIDDTRPWMIEIGSDVQITHGVTILTHGYDWSVLKGVYGEVLGSSGKVTIGDNVFIGANATILKGVTVGNNVIIGAGSLVNKDIPDNCVAAGNPARVIMSLDTYHEKRRAAQDSEARELVTEYRNVYNREPDAKVLSEFFWLFTDQTENLPLSWNAQLDRIANGGYSREQLKQNKPKYQDMEDFLSQIPQK